MHAYKEFWLKRACSNADTSFEIANKRQTLPEAGGHYIHSSSHLSLV